MTTTDKTVLITGANRGIGHALVEAALRRGAARVYAAARQPAPHPDRRVTPVRLDVTDDRQIRAVADHVDALDILINNAGVARYDDLSDRSVIEQHLAVNLFGTLAVSRAFLPALAATKGAVVNNVSANALAPLSLIPAYSISKAAAFNMTQSLRLLVAAQGIRVHAVLTGVVDTDMTRDLDVPKAAPHAVAEAIFDGVEAGAPEIFPDPMSASLVQSWRDGAAKMLENLYTAMLSAV